MSNDFNISANLEGLKAYFKSSDIKLSADDESKINTIFAECDTENEKGEKGADGILNRSERNTFLDKIKSVLPKLLQQVTDFVKIIDSKENAEKGEPKELSEATKPKILKKKLGSFTRVFIIPQEKTPAELKQLIKNCDINNNAQVAETLTILHNSFKAGDENLNKWIKKLFGKNLTSVEQPMRNNDIEYHLTDGRVIKRSGDSKSYGYIEIINPDSTVDKFKPYSYE